MIYAQLAIALVTQLPAAIRAFKELLVFIREEKKNASVADTTQHEAAQKK